MQKKDIIQLCIVGILIIVLVFLTIRVFSGKKRIPPPALKKGAGGEMAAEGKEGAKGLFARLEEGAKDLKIRRDPFFKKAQGSLSGPSLEGIVWDSKSPTAVINDKIVVIGSQIKGHTVVDIQKDRVIFSDNTRNIKFSLKLFE